MFMKWNSEILEKSFKGKFFGHQIIYFPETASTNDDAFSMGIAGAPEGTVLIADHQSRGKGRVQRSWHSPAGVNIYTSVILRPQIRSSESSWIPITAGVAVAEILESCYCPVGVSLKWPNDVLLNGKKVCGILSQARIARDKLDFVVLGIGVNVNITHGQFPEEIRDRATSLYIEGGKEIIRLELLIRLYENLEKWYKKLLQDGFGDVKENWLKLAPMIGKSIQVVFDHETINGTAAGLDEDGSLILLGSDNKQIKVSAGDATIKR